MKRISAILLVCLILFTMTSCGVKGSPSISHNCPKEHRKVIENYFKYYNEKNRKKLLTTLTDGYDDPNVVFGFKGLKSIRLISIEDDDANQVKAYMYNGRGTINRVREKNVAAYKVTYEAVYSKFIDPSPYSSGKQTEYFTLIKETDNSPWLIDDSGQS